jgi:hypothetical protein
MVMADSAKLTFHLQQMCEWKVSLAAFTRKFGRLRSEKGRILLRKHREVTGKFGRHVVTNRKVWPSFEMIVRVP